MKRFSWTGSLTSTLLCLGLGALLASACAEEANTLEPEEEGNGGKISGGSGGKSGGSGGKSGAFGGSSAGKATGGATDEGGAPTMVDGGEPPTSMGGVGGSTTPMDKCTTTDDCTQVADSCFVCEQAGAIKDCVDKGAPMCGDGELSPCEVCEEDDTKDCVELSTLAMPFSGGTATCKTACDGWDVSTCSVCGNDVVEDGETCDGANLGAGGAGGAGPVTCADEGISENPTTELDCTDTCEWDTTVCSGCSKGIAANDCLDGMNCTVSGNTNCNGAECKIGTTCSVSCSGGGLTCDDVQCNHDATCTFGCSSSGHCTNVVCDTDSTCTLNCAGGGSSCDGTKCRAGASCSFDCSTSGKCNQVQCDPGAECDFKCDGGGSQCGGTATCSDGMTCDFDCSNSGSCLNLNVTCEDGAVCNFTCTGGGSICPKADCKAGADCTFDCTGGNCNAPTCANGACTGNP
jgi:hypothetical protein